MAPHSPYNPAHRAVPLLDCYLCVLPVAPGPDRVNAMLERVWPTISRADAAAFAGHATLVRAVARHYAEEGHAER